MHQNPLHCIYLIIWLRFPESKPNFLELFILGLFLDNTMLYVVILIDSCYSH